MTENYGPAQGLGPVPNYGGPVYGPSNLGAPKPAKKPNWKQTWAIALVTGIVGLAIGAGGSGDTAATPKVAPTVTVTREVTQPAERVTATVTQMATAAPVPPVVPSEPTATSVGSATPEQEAAFLAANTGSNSDAATMLRTGYDLCQGLAQYETTAEQARYVVEVGTLWMKGPTAAMYLCSTYAEAGKLAAYGFEDGSYTVGTGEGEVAPGKYVTDEVSDCYWERVSDNGNTLANDFVSLAPKGVTVTIKKSDGGFVSTGCGVWLPA